MNSTAPGRSAVPPADYPLTKATPHPSPATHQIVLSYADRQLPDWPHLLAVWCLRRQRAYDLTHPFWSLATCAYATARDLLCFQLALTEPEAVAQLEQRVLIL